MEVSEIIDRDSFKAWLEDKPKEWAQVLAARCASRVAPFAWSVAALSDDVLEKKHRENLTLLTFRACLISSANRKYPADDMRAAAADAFAAARAAADAADAFAAAAADAARAAAFAAAGAARAAAAFAAARAAARAAAGAAAAADAFWNAVRADCLWLAHDLDLMSDDAEVPAEQAQNLMAQPLWLAQDEAGNFVQEHVPNALVNTFDKFQTSQLAQETSFGLIADWYIAAQEGKTAFGKKAELAIALMSKEDWGDEDDERDCIAVMDRVAKLAGWGRGDGVVGDGVDEEDLFKPEAINQGIGPTFSANEKKELDRLPALPNFEENQNPALSKVFDRLKKRLNSLKAALGNNLSRYPQLAEILDDYEDALGCSDITEIDIDELWISGVGLISQARAFAALDPSKQVTDPLEPQAQGILGELARLHGGLIMGFSRGRELAEQSGIPLLSNEEFIALLEYEKTIVRWLLESDHYALSDKSRELFQQLDNIFYSTNESADAAAKIGYPVLRNLIIHTANTLEYAEKKAGQLSLVGVPVSLLVTGVLAMLQSNLSPILAFANSVPELRAYLEYHLHRLEIEFEESDKGNEDNST